MEGDVIELQETGWGGRYVIRLGAEEAELTFRQIGAALIAIDHTFTPRAFRGQGTALRLLERAVADARLRGDRIVPLCSFAAQEFGTHPEWDDLLGDFH